MLELDKIKDEKDLEEVITGLEEDGEDSILSEEKSKEMFNQITKEQEASINLLDYKLMIERIVAEDDNIILTEEELAIKDIYDNFCSLMKENGIKVVPNHFETVMNEEMKIVSTGKLFLKAIATHNSTKLLEQMLENSISGMSFGQLEKIAKKRVKVNNKRWRNIKKKMKE